MTNQAVGPARVKLIVAFAILYFVWGSTYLAIRFAIETMPPIWMAGTRFVIAGAVLLLDGRLDADSPGSCDDADEAIVDHRTIDRF